MDFDDFFTKATGTSEPYEYQRRIAQSGLPEALEVPTGAGKTAAVVLPWLYRLLIASHAETPRTLVFMLPVRTLVEQTTAQVRKWLGNLELTNEVRIVVLMGGRSSPGDELNEWRRNPHQPSVVIGTVDSILSRGLVRGYAQPRTTYPIDFARVTDDAHWVIDEVQLAQQAAATARQLAAFRFELGTFRPGGLTCMSATIPREPLDTVDHPFRPETVVGLTDDDRVGPLRQRLEATRIIRSLPVPTPTKLVQAIADEHRAGTLTLVIVNTVALATDLRTRISKKSKAELVLLHSRFRGIERATHVETLSADLPPEGRIVISTQVIEAGVDLDAVTLFTEVAPWSSICQRAGRCNRAGETNDEAQLIWFPSISKASPYDTTDLAASTETLADLEGKPVTSEDLLHRRVNQSQEFLTMLRRRDFAQLFDTSPDLSGTDIDVAMFIRPTEDLDVTIAWVDPEQIVDGRIIDVPMEPWRCAVPIGAARHWLKSGPRSWIFDPVSGKWQPTHAHDLRPNRLILVDKQAGGYDPDLGFLPSSKQPVSTQDWPRITNEPVFEGVSEGIAQDEGSTGQRGWQRLDQHLAEAQDHAQALFAQLAPTGLAQDVRIAVQAAAGLHDLGKNHRDWQLGLVAANDTAGFAPPGDGPWAKSPGRGRLTVKNADGSIRRGFRHELVSALHLRTEAGREVLSRMGVPEEHHPLTIYLVGAHHGHIRIQPRDPLTEGRNGATMLGLRHGEILPEIVLGDRVFPETIVDFSVFGMGSQASWSRAALRLLDRWGAFRLAWFEMIVRMADWRSSAGDSQPVEK